MRRRASRRPPGRAADQTDAQVEGLRDAGWTDEQIAEATYVAALFNLFVRLADAFDIHPPPILDARVFPERSHNEYVGPPFS